jgi:hypothetical protein
MPGFQLLVILLIQNQAKGLSKWNWQDLNKETSGNEKENVVNSVDRDNIPCIS